MVYTLGPLHDLLSGSGTVSLDKPAGLLLTVLGYPIGVGVQPGTPTTLHRFGHITPGDPNGWYPKVQIIQTTQLVLPMPADCTLCGYDTAATSGLSIRELVGGPVPGSNPFDRSPVAIYLASNSQVNGGTSATLWTYTVPTGRKLHVSSGDLAATRSGVATTASALVMYLMASGVGFHQLFSWNNTLGLRDFSPLAPDGMTFDAGVVLSAYYQDFSTGGAHHLSAALQGYTFLA